MEFSDGYEGVGICLNQAQIDDPERVVDLIGLARNCDQSFIKFCAEHDIQNVSMHDFTEWIGCEKEMYAVAEILCQVIREIENIPFKAWSIRYGDDDDSIYTFVIHEEQDDLDHEEENNRSSVEEVLSEERNIAEVLMKYFRVVSNDTPQYRRWLFDDYGVM